jgi:hypothetical protein
MDLMPLKETTKRRVKKQGKSLSTQAAELVREELHHFREAVAKTKQKVRRATSSPKKKPSRTRAVRAAAKKEPRSSTRTLSRARHQAAMRRGKPVRASAAKSAAKKPARTRRSRAS